MTVLTAERKFDTTKKQKKKQSRSVISTSSCLSIKQFKHLQTKKQSMYQWRLHDFEELLSSRDGNLAGSSVTTWSSKHKRNHMTVHNKCMKCKQTTHKRYKWQKNKMEGNREHSHWSAHHALLFVKDGWLLIFRFITAVAILSISDKMVRSIGASQKKWSGQLSNPKKMVRSIKQSLIRRLPRWWKPDESAIRNGRLTACTHAAFRMHEAMETCKRTELQQMAICQRTGVGLVVVKKSVKVPTIK